MTENNQIVITNAKTEKFVISGNEKIKEIYTKIQNQLFYMIPEKWERIYLYASVINRLGNLKTGEMFFYYFPKGILKKNPINGYEIPTRFNLEEDEYLKLIVKLYDLIKELKTEFQKQGKMLWNSITIKIEGVKFTVEFNYDELPSLEKQIEAQHIFWAYKNLQMSIESFNKKQRQLLIEELEKNQSKIQNITTYSEKIYKNRMKNTVQYNREKTEYFLSEANEKNESDDEESNYLIKTQILSGLA